MKKIFLLLTIIAIASTVYAQSPNTSQLDSITITDDNADTALFTIYLKSRPGANHGHEYKITARTLKEWIGTGASGAGWGLKGNAGTDPSTNFIGTKDDIPLLFKQNNTTLGYINDGIDQTSFGSSMPFNSSSGSSAFGTQAGVNDTSGSLNTYIGFNSGNGNYTGSRNTFLGYNARIFIDGLHDATAIGANALCDTSNELTISDDIIKIHAMLNGSAAGNVLTDVNGDGNWTSRPPSGGGFSIDTDAVLSLTADKFDSLSSQPQQILPAPGAGYAWEIIIASLNFISNGADPSLGFFVITPSINIPLTSENFSYTIPLLSGNYYVNGVFNNSFNTSTLVENSPLIVVSSNDDPLGNGTGKFYITAKKRKL